MTPSEIQKRIRDAKTSQRAIAHKLDVSEVSVSDVVNGKRVSDRIMQVVAETINKDKRMVFPWYYLKPPLRSTSKVSRSL